MKKKTHALPQMAVCIIQQSLSLEKKMQHSEEVQLLVEAHTLEAAECTFTPQYWIRMMSTWKFRFDGCNRIGYPVHINVFGAGCMRNTVARV